MRFPTFRNIFPCKTFWNALLRQRYSAKLVVPLFPIFHKGIFKKIHTRIVV